jgi:hypothetical protein
VLGDTDHSELKLEIYHGDAILPPTALAAAEKLAQAILAPVAVPPLVLLNGGRRHPADSGPWSRQQELLWPAR